MKDFIQNLIVFASFITFSSSCNTHHPERTNYELPVQSSVVQNWAEVFADQPRIDSFKILNTGSVKVPLTGMLNPDKMPENHDFGKFIWVDVFAFLFHHVERGWYLIDTGLDSTFQKRGNVSGFLAGKYIKGTRQQKGQNIAAQLAREGKVLEGIFLTHLHGDHTSGLPEIDPSIPKFVGKGEDHIYLPMLYTPNHLDADDTLIELDWEKGRKMEPLECAIDVFGDGSFFAIHTPGHSNSHLSYLLHTSDEIFLLTGDASHTKFGFENNIEPGWTVDQDQAERSLMQLRRLKELHPSIKVIYGHQL